MSRSRIVAVMLCAALLAACGGKTGEAKTNPVEAVFKDPLTSKQIKKALLTLDDMPSGYSEDPDLVSDDDDSEDEVTKGSPQCKKLMSAIEEEDEKPFGEGDVGFKESDFGPFIMESVASHEGDLIKDSMGELREAFSTCKKFESTDAEGAVTKFTVAEMSFPELGDDTVAVKMSGKESSFGFTFDFNLVAVRVDQNVILMVNFGVGRALGGKKFEQLARLAVERVSAAG
jgi:hypothetical protein